MVKEILYTTALDKEDNLVHINNAVKGIQYFCPTCKNEFILRKSGKSGKGSRRSHFAHNEISPNCTPESVLHSSFKKMLITLLQKCKNENKPFIINWNCNNCHGKFSENLLHKVHVIKEEFNLTECKPDIALLDENENVFAVIEIVVTHEPDDKALEYYKKNNITLIQLNLSSDEDLNIIEEKMAHPDIVDLCLNFNKCQSYNTNIVERKSSYEIVRCNVCLNQFKICHIITSYPFGNRRSFDYNETVKLYGIQLEVRNDMRNKKLTIIQGRSAVSTLVKFYSGTELVY